MTHDDDGTDDRAPEQTPDQTPDQTLDQAAEQVPEQRRTPDASTAMVTALVRLRGALQEVRLPLELPGADEQRGARAEMVDQIEDYARRRGLPVGEVERWLRPNLAYDVD